MEGSRPVKTILLLEDDENLNRGIALKLSKEGYHMLTAYTIGEAEALFQREEVHMVISDITLPDGNGLEFGRNVRARSNVYLLYLTALDQELDIVNGFDSGADDYITKPFSVTVLTSKVNALMRRLEDSRKELLVTEQFEISLGELQVRKDGEIIALSRTELQLFLYLVEHAGKIMTKENILEKIWGLDGQFVDDNTVTVNISRLKNKLGTECISNVRGLGYIWTSEVSTK